MSTNDICERAVRKRVKVTLRVLDSEDPDPTILVEGTSDALRFLGELLIAQADGGPCGFSIGPSTSGSKFFSPESHFGIYIHRLPCDHLKEAPSGEPPN